MEIKVEELKFDKWVSLSQRCHYYLREDGKHIRHGLFESWHPNGKKDNETHFEHGRSHGKATIWRSDGSMRHTGEYKKNREEGLWQYWHADSKLMARVVYEKRRPQEGDYYLPDGELIASVKNGTGRSVFYTDEGRMSVEAIWKEGKKVKHAIWYDNGQLEKKEEFSENELLVTGEYFAPTGKKLSEVRGGNGVCMEPLFIENSDGTTKVMYSEDPCINGVVQPGKWSDQIDILSEKRF